jgi:hypothetical protein
MLGIGKRPEKACISQTSYLRSPLSALARSGAFASLLNARIAFSFREECIAALERAAVHRSDEENE